MTKSELRKYIKSVIPQSREEKLKESQRICSQIIQSLEYKEAPLILAYAGMDDEVILNKVIDDALNRGKSLGLPRIREESGLMDFYQITPASQLQAESRFGIQEPMPLEKELIEPEKLPDNTLILVPGRAFTIEGIRLGRGKGFYDQWLCKIPEVKKNRVRLYGVCFPQQIVENIPCDEHDIKMTRVIY